MTAPTEPDRVAGRGTLTRSLVLLPVTASTPQARHWVAEQLADLPREARDSAVLLVSELVTNAVLHAVTPVVVSVHRFYDRVRVDVADRSPMAPAARSYEVDAVTGRGLSLLELLPSAWGVQPIPDGKIVWCELPVDVPLDLPVTGAEEDVYRFDLQGLALAAADPPLVDIAGVPSDDRGPVNGRGPVGSGTVGDPLAGALPVTALRGTSGAGADAALTDVGLFGVFGLFVLDLRGAPSLLMQRAAEHYEALFREFRLIVEQDQDPEHPRELPDHLRGLIGMLGTRFSGFGWPLREQWLSAIEDGSDEVDLTMALPTDVGPRCLRFDRLLDEVDEHCRAADLITLPADHACAAVRHWVLDEVARQAAGQAPQRWARSRWSRGTRRARHLVRPSWATGRRRL
jgi:hypothetical protein